ncbi:outer membrane protein assembly factor [Echinicola strongylocentroti]|uniref:Outer membrane protein assembly factor n=2 Tax=Echinicola strongylocentroti TaxID=1795355 RepID=A0A2Z4IIF8_9BACT|nr:outer membrane protein assembly factor [Echinicola strongylocentroti]
MWSWVSVQAQQGYELQYEITGEHHRKGTKEGLDTLGVQHFLQGELKELWSEGYLMAEVVDLTYHDSVAKATITTRDKFRWMELRRGNLSESLVRRAGGDPRDFRGQPVSYKKVARLFEKLLGIQENQGYPFAAVRLDSITQEGNGFQANIWLEKGPFIQFDSLKISGNARVKKVILGRKLGIVPGEPFSQKAVESAFQLLKEMPYYEVMEPPRVSFQNSEATVYLSLQNRKVNALDGIIGLLPNEAEANKLMVTGQFDLAIYNPVGRGRQYGLHWQRLTQYSQNLEVSAVEPQLFGTGIDVNASFFLLKEDTTFVNRDFRLGFGYQVRPRLYLDVFSKWKAGDLLSVPEVNAAEELPAELDFRYHSYGLRLHYQQLDDGYQPKNGWRLIMEGGVGNKKILQNTGIPEGVYEEVDTEAIQTFGTMSLEEYWRVSNRLVGFLRLRGGLLLGDNILKNDMYRLGGLRTLRGFNENFFFANRYVYANFEPRFYFEENSYFLLFTDVGALEQSGWALPDQLDKIISFGAGLNLRTGNGEFRFLYGMGRSNEQEIGVNYAKIHFGYIGRF